MAQQLEYASVPPRTDPPNGLAARVSRVATASLPPWFVAPVLTLAVAAFIGLCMLMIGSSGVGRSSSAQLKAAGTELSMLHGALDRFERDVGRFPTAQEGLHALIDDPFAASGWNGPYLLGGKVPLDAWGHAYIYVPDDYGSFRLLSVGPDGKEGTEDDIDSSGPRLPGNGR